jgi:hypothetical protein
MVTSMVSIAAIVAGVLTSTTVSSAAWNDTEFDHGDVTALNCATNTDLASRARGRFLTGTVLTANLDTIAGLQGVTVSNDGTTVTHSSGATAGSAPDSWGQGIAATALAGIVNAEIGPLTLPLNQGTGTLNQYGEAHDTGKSRGASGAVTSEGAIDTSAVTAGTAGTVGTLSLSTLPGIGSTLAGLADVGVEVGAVAAVANLDGCAQAWSGASTPSATQLQRSYLVSSLKAKATSPVVGAVFGSTVPTAVNGISTTLNTLIGASGADNGTAETSVASAALASLDSAIAGILGNIDLGVIALGVGTGAKSTGITVDLAPVTAALTGSVTDGVVTTNLATGAITVDINALTGGLNTQLPNTRVLTAAQLDDVTLRVKALLVARTTYVNTLLETALANATIVVKLDSFVTTRLLTTTVVGLKVHVEYSGTLAEFRAGTANYSGPTITNEDTSILGGVLGLVTGPLNLLLPPLVSGTVRTAVQTALNTNLFTPVNGLIVSTLNTATTAVNTATAVLDPLLDVLGGILDLRLNVRPDVTPFPNRPFAGSVGEYYQSALAITVLGSVGGPSILQLHLANASVGPNAH